MGADWQFLHSGIGGWLAISSFWYGGRLIISSFWYGDRLAISSFWYGGRLATSQFSVMHDRKSSSYPIFDFLAGCSSIVIVFTWLRRRPLLSLWWYPTSWGWPDSPNLSGIWNLPPRDGWFVGEEIFPSLEHVVLGARCPWSTLSLEHVVLGARCPWSTLSLEHVVLGARCPWSTLSLEHVVLGARCPWSTLSLEHIVLGACCPWSTLSLEHVVLAYTQQWSLDTWRP